MFNTYLHFVLRICFRFKVFVVSDLFCFDKNNFIKVTSATMSTFNKNSGALLRRPKTEFGCLALGGVPFNPRSGA